MNEIWPRWVLKIRSSWTQSWQTRGHPSVCMMRDLLTACHLPWLENYIWYALKIRPGTSWVQPNNGSYIYSWSFSTLPISQFPYPMLFASIQTLILCFVSWITLKLFRRILARSSLDTLPSPPPTSLVFGESIHHFASIHLTVLGNIPELYHPEGWDFHRKILESCKYPVSIWRASHFLTVVEQMEPLWK